MKKLITACFILLTVPVFAQEYQQEYMQGKEFLKEGKYALAMESLKPLVTPGSDNALSKYAMYFYAVAAYKDGYTALSKDMFLQIKNLYPDWRQLDEVHLWLAKIYLENNNFNQALNVIQNIDDRGLDEEKEQLFESYASKIDDLVLIEQLYETNENNKPLAKRYAELIAKQPLQKRDQELLSKLIRKFNLDPDKFGAGVIEENVFKDKYRIAVLLPFVHKKLDVSLRPKPNQFVLDMYHGIRMAVDSLRNAGIDLELFVYDTRREYNTTQEILQKPELKTMDLIIGPLYSQPLELVQDFAFRNKINMINPLSNNPAVIGSSPFTFLFKPSYETIGNAMGEYARTIVRNPNGIIIYGESEADSILAYSYKRSFESEGDNKIVHIEQITADNPRRVLDLLVTEGKKLKEANDPDRKVELTIAPDSVGSIYVASDENLIITRVLSGIETRSDTIKILGSEKWLDIGAIDYSALERLDVAMASPSYYDYNRSTFVQFRENYLQRYRELPSDFAILGFELMMFAGKTLNDHGKYFQLELKDKPAKEGVLLSGYNYSGGNDNQVVPIVKVVDSEPQIVEIKNYARYE